MHATHFPAKKEKFQTIWYVYVFLHNTKNISDDVKSKKRLQDIWIPNPERKMSGQRSLVASSVLNRMFSGTMCYLQRDKDILMMDDTKIIDLTYTQYSRVNYSHRYPVTLFFLQCFQHSYQHETTSKAFHTSKEQLVAVW